MYQYQALFAFSLKFVFIKPLGNALDCDFKKNDLCQWEHDLTNAGTWRTNTGTTPTDETGPDHGHGETGCV